MSITFRYFEHPHQFSTYREGPEQCDLCGREGSGYAGPFYGVRDIDFVCEDCLASGRLEAFDISTNEGDAGALQLQLQALRPDLRDDARDLIARERTAELEYRTPHLVTWQDFFWPAHCGDYCRFIKEVGQPELIRLSSEGNGLAFLATHAKDINDLAHAMEVWSGVRPDIPMDRHLAYSLGVYLFRCLTCGEYVLLWDCE